ncbi:unnamed protein product, partial [Amoebophrya sp. A25]|eukprot:GSA25T00016912001.1
MDSLPVGTQKEARLYKMGYIERADVLDYRICFAENQYVVPPEVPRYFMEAGILSLSGPNQDSVIAKCIMGERCVAAATGVNLRQENIGQIVFG